MKLFFIITVTAILIGCAASTARIDPARVSALKKGQTTVDEVTRQFGRPSVISRNPDGTQSAIYFFGREGESGTTMVPLIGSAPADSTTFYFDTRGVLTDFKTKEAERPAPVPATAAATPSGTQASSDQSAPAKASPAQTARKPLPPNVTDRWPGSTTENR